MFKACAVPIVLAAALAAIPSTASAEIVTLSFARITSNASQNVASQLSVDVMDKTSAIGLFGAALINSAMTNPSDVLFVFKNTAVLQSSIGEVYFDDGTILAQSAVLNSLGGGANNSTDFEGGGANPNNLSGGELLNPDFVATAGFSADYTNGPTTNGVDTSADRLGIVFSTQLATGLAGIKSTLANGALRIGLHVKGLGEKGLQSDSFVNNTPIFAPPPPPVPEPASFLLLAMGGCGLVAFRRFRAAA